MVATYGEGVTVCAGCGRVMFTRDLKDGKCPNCAPSATSAAGPKAKLAAADEPETENEDSGA